VHILFSFGMTCCVSIWEWHVVFIIKCLSQQCYVCRSNLDFTMDNLVFFLSIPLHYMAQDWNWSEWHVMFHLSPTVLFWHNSILRYLQDLWHYNKHSPEFCFPSQNVNTLDRMSVISLCLPGPPSSTHWLR
jgi:hypothetical protein